MGKQGLEVSDLSGWEAVSQTWRMEKLRRGAKVWEEEGLTQTHTAERNSQVQERTEQSTLFDEINEVLEKFPKIDHLCFYFNIPVLLHCYFICSSYCKIFPT